MKLITIVTFCVLGILPTMVIATTYGGDDCELMKRYGQQQGRTVNNYDTCLSVCKKAGSVYGMCPVICEKCGFKKSNLSGADGGSSGYTSIKQIEGDGKMAPGVKVTMWCLLSKDLSSKKIVKFMCKDSEYSKERDEFLSVRKNEAVDEIIDELKDSRRRKKIDFEITEVNAMSGPTLKILKVN